MEKGGGELWGGQVGVEGLVTGARWWWQSTVGKWPHLCELLLCWICEQCGREVGFGAGAGKL